MLKTIHSFIVRISYEAADQDGKGTVWRGCIEHVGSGVRLHFYDLEGVTRFIEEQAGLKTERRHLWWKSLWKRTSI